MKNQRETNEELFQRYLDGELSGSEEKRALHMIADDAEMRDMLRFERSLGSSLNADPGPDSFSVPVNFADKVMAGIESGSAVSDVNAGHELQEKAETEAKVHRFAVHPFLAAAVVIISIGLGFLFSLSIDQPAEIAEAPGVSAEFASEEEQLIWIRFVYFDEDAESLEVAGDFSDWNPVELNREFAGGKQVWTGMIPVERGEHRYMFVRNGEEWVTDPLAEVQQDDGFGNKNAVLFL